MLRIISALFLLTALATACASTTPEEEPVEVVVVEEVPEPEPEPAPAPVAAPPAAPARVLPDTATQAPALALMGFGAIGAGLLVGAVRRRL